MTLLPLVASAYNALVNGIYYNLDKSSNNASVTYRAPFSPSYSGDVTIPETVTYDGVQYRVTAITANAFFSCSDLTSVSIPSCITEIGISAFQGCYKLTEVSLPENITSIANSTFYECSRLVSVVIPDGVTSIGEYAFWNCQNLLSIDLPDAVTTIGRNAFRGCTSLSTITIEKNVETVEDIPFNACSGLSSVTFHCKSIGQWFDSNTNIKEVNIGDEVEIIGNSAFYGFKGLKSIELPNSITTIGNSSFSNCNNLKDIVLSENLKSIGESAFYRCDSLKSIVLPKGLENISSSAFYECHNIESVTLNMPSVSTWFQGKTALREVILGESVKNIEDQAFLNCSSLAAINLPDGLEKIGSYAFAGCTSLSTVIMPGSVSSVGNFAFRNCESLSCLKLSDAITFLGEYAFQNCKKLERIDIPSSLTDIGNYVFYGCTGLKSIVIPNSVESIGYGAFYGCNLSSLTIGSNVKTINDSFNTEIKKVLWLGNTPPSGYTNASGKVNYVANDLYSSLSNKTIYHFLSSIFEVDGIRYVPVIPSERICDAIDCVYDSTAVNTTVGAEVTFRGITMKVRNAMPYLCHNNQHIKNVVWAIGGDIPQYAFAECSNIQQFYTGRASRTGTLVIDAKVNSIGNYAFSGCKGFNTVIISDRDSTLTLGSNGKSPLFSSFDLDSIYIGGNISYPTSGGYGYSPFYRNTSLRSVVITDREEEISENEFYGCTSLQNVEIGDGVTEIGNRAFSGCASLQHFGFGSQVKSIGAEAFSDCTALTAIISKAEVPPTCGSQALDDVNKWECTLTVPEGSVDAYQAADQWKEFFFVEEGDENGSAPIDPNGKKCATPAIVFADGKLTFTCETEGVEYAYEVTNADVKKGLASEAEIAGTYKVSVYATKAGYEDSDTATLEFTLGAGGGSCDVNGDGAVDVADIATIISNMADRARAAEKE